MPRDSKPRPISDAEIRKDYAACMAALADAEDYKDVLAHGMAAFIIRCHAKERGLKLED